jgi:hypothetical protein
MLWLAPFALASAGAFFSARGLAVLMGPWLLNASAAAWLSWGPYVEGPLPKLTDRGRAEDERVVRDTLRARGVEAATAEYWLAYRLSLLFEAQPVVVPLNPGQDRVPLHRQQFEQARHVAFIFHPSEPRATPEPFIQMLAARNLQAQVENIAGFTVIFARR